MIWVLSLAEIHLKIPQVTRETHLWLKVGYRSLRGIYFLDQPRGLGNI